MQSFTDSRESIDSNFSDYLSVLKRHWVPAVSIFASTVVLSIFAASLLKSSYQAEGRLLFKNSTFKVLGSNLVPSTTEGGESADIKPLVSNQNPLATQIEILSSNLLLQRTIEKLRIKNDRGELLKTTELQSNLNVKIVGGADVLQVNYKNRDPNYAASVVNTLMNVYVENDMLTNRVEAEAASQFMGKQLPQTKVAVDRAEIALRKFKQQNSIIDLSEESKTAVGTIRNLESGITTTQSQLEDLKAQNKELRQKIKLSSQDAITFSATSQSPAIQGILTQLQDLDRQMAIESSRFSDNNPILVALKDKKVKLNTLLKQQIRSTTGSKVDLPPGSLRVGELKQNLIKDLLQSEVQLTGATKKLASLQNALTAYKKRVRVMPQLVQTQHQLERQLDVSQSTYQNLLKKVQEIQLAKNNNISNARIINNAVIPDRADSTTKNIVIGLGGLIGALLSTSAIAYLEMRDKFVEPGKDGSKLFRNRLLGAMPVYNNSAYALGNSSPELTKLEVTVRDIRKSLSSDAFQIIQFNLRSVDSDKVLKVIIITSTLSSEEKSKKAADLATAIAGSGQKVLLIDADTRNPYQHQFWKLPLEKGLSELLAGKSKFQQISWRVMDNLDVLTAGTRSPNSLFSFESQPMKSLIQEVSRLYDFAIVDTSPLLVSANAMNMSHLNDGILTIDLQDDVNSSIHN
jgi:capsular exopolysaccharide synthesis family protein